MNDGWAFAQVLAVLAVGVLLPWLLNGRYSNPLMQMIASLSASSASSRVKLGCRSK